MTGKEVMLDEIINYMQSFQCHIEVYAAEKELSKRCSNIVQWKEADASKKKIPDFMASKSTFMVPSAVSSKIGTLIGVELLFLDDKVSLETQETTFIDYYEIDDAFQTKSTNVKQMGGSYLHDFLLPQAPDSKISYGITFDNQKHYNNIFYSEIKQLLLTCLKPNSLYSLTNFYATTQAKTCPSLPFSQYDSLTKSSLKAMMQPNSSLGFISDTRIRKNLEFCYECFIIHIVN
ncbi:hypothetical protein YC2023_118282 [Brassica napus]